MKHVAAAAILVLLVSARAMSQDPPTADPKDSPAPATPAEKVPDQAQLDKWFTETMSGATLVGHFTVDGRGSGAGEPKEERYTIQKVTKQQGDYWLFLARIQFGGRDVTIPMRIPVKWAGDTAVISVTDLGFPGLGTYTARVLVYGKQYAGTWSGKDHGGHLWGRIERADKDDAGADSSAEPGEKKPAAAR
jgi:hypothetical protein